MLYLVSRETAGADAEITLHRTLADAQERKQESVFDALRDSDRECSVFLYPVDDWLQLLTDHVEFEEWHGRWEDHWESALADLNEAGG